MANETENKEKKKFGYIISVYDKSEQDGEHLDSFVPKNEEEMVTFMKGRIGKFINSYCSSGDTLIKKMEKLHLFDGHPLCLDSNKISIEYHSGTIKYWSVWFNYYIRISHNPGGGKETACMLVDVQTYDKDTTEGK